MRTTLNDNMGRPIGSIDIQPDGRQVLTNRIGVRLGEYDPRFNVTRDNMGRPVGNGNLLAMLLR
jgi:hypothetical protein